MTGIGETRAAIRARIAQALLAAGLVAATVLMLAPQGAPTPRSLFGLDKIDHFMAFMVLAFVAAQAFPTRRLWLIGLGLAAYGGAIEVVQRFVGRSMDLLDFAADVAGILVGLTLAVIAGRTNGHLSQRSGS